MRTNSYKKAARFCSILLAGILCFGCTGNNAANTITLNGEEILYNGKMIDTASESTVYKSTFVEFHDDVTEQYKDTANTIIHITKGGVYQISGEAHNTQIRVNAPDEEVTLVLNNVNLTCHTAPAILIAEAADPKTAGEASVTIALNDDSSNIINGSHIAKYTNKDGVEIDYDGAISSKVSLNIEGNGVLEVIGDKEGIESQMHLTINGGNITVIAADDPLNASEDNVSVITINDGFLNCSVQNGEEGDGIDSNGYIYINGGTVLAQSHNTSGDSGLDADLGVIINGGTVCATGNMFDEISGESAQPHIQLNFAEKQKGGIPLVITDAEGNYVLAYTPINDFHILDFSAPTLIADTTYYLYCGGTITGTIVNGIYTEVSNYEGGIQMGHRGLMQDGKRPDFTGEPPEGVDPSNITRPEGKVPPSDSKQPQHPNDMRPQDENGDAPQMPEHFGPENKPQPPQESISNKKNNVAQNVSFSTDFFIGTKSCIYTDITVIR